MGIFSSSRTSNDNRTTVNTSTTVNPNINIENDFTQAGQALSTVIAESGAELGQSLDKGIKTMSAIALLFVVGSVF